ncbi:MAG: hypothetical protein LUE26_03145, partial [Alistipes sp.]|nr:hypothetical protein [Alistipes sp.]
GMRAGNGEKNVGRKCGTEGSAGKMLAGKMRPGRCGREINKRGSRIGYRTCYSVYPKMRPE